MRKFLKRASCIAAALFLCFSLSFPARAASIEVAYSSINIDKFGSTGGSSDQFPLPITEPKFFTNYASYAGLKNGNWISYFADFNVPVKNVSGTVGFYLTFSIDFSSSDVSLAGTSAVALRNDSYGQYTTSSGDVKHAPLKVGRVSNSPSNQRKYTISWEISAEEGNPIRDLGWHYSSSTSPLFQPGIAPGLDIDDFDRFTYYVRIFNWQIIGTETSEELAQLEYIADSIANQSNILSDMYGDLMAICNAIYERTGDLKQAADLTNQYFAQLIPILNSIKTTTVDIYTLLGTQFQLLINTIKQEGLAIRDSIAAAELRLEEYLKPVIDYINSLEESTGEGPSTLPDHKNEADGFNNQGFGIDSDGQTGLSAILPIFSTFSFILSILSVFIGLGVIKMLVKKGLG